MAQLWELLGIGKGLTAVMGSGGKTSLLYELAEELRPYGTVLLATTTHIMRPPQYPFAATASALTAALAAHGAACAGSFTAEGKLTAPDFPGWETAADFVLVEADGAKGLPLKAHAAHEPVIPPCAQRVVTVVGIDGIGKPIGAACHRSARYAQLALADEEALVTPEIAARVRNAEGGFDRVYINTVESAAAYEAAQAMAKELSCPVVAGSLHQGVYVCLH